MIDYPLIALLAISFVLLLIAKRLLTEPSEPEIDEDEEYLAQGKRPGSFGNLLAVLLVLIGAGCHGSSSSSDRAVVDVSGTWIGSWSSSVTPLSGGSMVMILAQEQNDDVKGTGSMNSPCGGGAGVEGRVRRRRFRGLIQIPTGTVEFDLVWPKSETEPTLVGDYRILNGNCTDDEGSIQLTTAPFAESDDDEGRPVRTIRLTAIEWEGSQR